MTDVPNMDGMKQYFSERLTEFGTTPRGADWNSQTSQEIRFDQLLKIVKSPAEQSEPFTLLDYGCGYGALASYLKQRNYSFRYLGYDLLESMVEAARLEFSSETNLSFSSHLEDLGEADYSVISGVFNIRFETSNDDWTQYVLHTLDQINTISRKGFSFNCLTKYSDADHMKPHLYYADPCLLFDYCKRNFSRNVALIHDYDLYDFTILVRKTI